MAAAAVTHLLQGTWLLGQKHALALRVLAEAA